MKAPYLLTCERLVACSTGEIGRLIATYLAIQSRFPRPPQLSSLLRKAFDRIRILR